MVATDNRQSERTAMRRRIALLQVGLMAASARNLILRRPREEVLNEALRAITNGRTK